MNTSTNLIFTVPTPQEIPTVAPDTDASVEPGNDGDRQLIDFDKKFDSILHNQLQEGQDTPAAKDSLNLLASTEDGADLLAKTAIVTEPLIGVDPSTTVETSTSPDSIALVDPAVRVDPAALANSAVRADPAALIDPAIRVDPAALIDPAVRVDPAVLVDPAVKLTNTDKVAVIDTSTKLDADSLEITDVNSLITASDNKKPVVTVAQEANTLLEASKIASAEISLEEAKNGAHIELSTVAATSRPSPAGPVGLEIQTNTRSASNSPVAGSPATLTEEVALSSRQAVNVEDVSVTESEQTQWSGKSAPPRGNTLPGNLPFLTNTDGKPSQIEDISDFINKAVFQNQQLSQSSESKPVLQQSVQSEAAPTVANVGNLIGAEKSVSGRNPGAFNAVGNTSFVVEAPAGSSDWNNQVGDKIRWMGRVNISSAELKLHPAELGTVEIKISTEDDRTKVSFLTGTTATKEIIEASLPRLRDLLSSSGLQLEQSDVSQKNLSENRTNQQELNTEDAASNDTSVVNEDTALLVRQHSLNQIDHYV